MSVYVGFYYGDTSNINHTLCRGFSKVGSSPGVLSGLGFSRGLGIGLQEERTFSSVWSCRGCLDP